MANRFAVANGNFNDTATWSTTAAGSPGASVPIAGDNAIANNRTVTITANAACDNVTNTTIYGGTAGGSFVLQNGVTLAATTISASAVSVVQFSQASPAGATLTISETISNGNPAIVTNSNTGTLNINASVFRNNASGATASGILNSGAGIVNFTGVLSQTGGASAAVISNSSTGTINVNGTNVGRAISNGSTGTITWNGELTALNDSPAITSTTAGSTVRASGNFIFSANGTVPIYAQRFILGTTPNAAKTQYALNGTGTYVNMFTADNSLTQAAPADVRSGTVYADGNLTGTLAVPAAGSVALGVPVDATTGTAVLTGSDIANAVWGALLSSHTTNNTFGAHVVRSLNSNNTLQLTGSHHAAADVHEFQDAVITAGAFAPSTITLFSDAMRTELTPELDEISEVHLIHGLQSGSALTVTPSSRTAGAISQTIAGDGTTSTTVTRD